MCSILRKQGVPFIATDWDPLVAVSHRRDGYEVYFGDASDPEFLKACGLDNATGIIITINFHENVDRIVTQVRSARPDIPIIARARDADHARHLYKIGASEAVPETIEASLQLSEAALVGLGVAQRRGQRRGTRKTPRISPWIAEHQAQRGNAAGLKTATRGKGGLMYAAFGMAGRRWFIAAKTEALRCG